MFFRDGMFVVGPESAGAHPGPTCYRKGGPLTVTDANLVLGRLRIEGFPRIFGPNHDEPLDVEATRREFSKLTATINRFLAAGSSGGSEGTKSMTVEAVALGFIRVANETMCRPIRELTQSRGFDASNHKLACFGGAGGQHACAVARSLGMGRIHISRFSGILSAYGLAAADVVEEVQEPSAATLEASSYAAIAQRLRGLAETSVAKLQAQGFSMDQIFVEPFANLRYGRTNCALMVSVSSTGPCLAAELGGRLDVAQFEAHFLAQYRREFGFTIPGRELLIDDLRVRGTGRTSHVSREPLLRAQADAAPIGAQPIHFAEGSFDTPVYDMASLLAGHVVPGPALLADTNSTVLVEPGCSASVTADGDLEVVIGEGKPRAMTTDLDVIHLSVFQHRFMTIAEQMGRALQRTSISTNIKERLDFSCALFSPDGGLVANAPHIPVHLGAMQEAVRFQIQLLGDDLQPGDVLVSNHPAAGGSHLPDITVITPVFCDGFPTPIFWVASRGHHADIGGITPGSMPPHSTSLAQEGAAIMSFKLVSDGHFDEEGITEILSTPSGKRNSVLVICNWARRPTVGWSSSDILHPSHRWCAIHAG